MSDCYRHLSAKAFMYEDPSFQLTDSLWLSLKAAGMLLCTLYPPVTNILLLAVAQSEASSVTIVLSAPETQSLLNPISDGH